MRAPTRPPPLAQMMQALLRSSALSSPLLLSPAEVYCFAPAVPGLDFYVVTRVPRGYGGGAFASWSVASAALGGSVIATSAALTGASSRSGVQGTGYNGIQGGDNVFIERFCFPSGARAPMKFILAVRRSRPQSALRALAATSSPDSILRLAAAAAAGPVTVQLSVGAAAANIDGPGVRSQATLMIVSQGRCRLAPQFPLSYYTFPAAGGVYTVRVRCCALAAT